MAVDPELLEILVCPKTKGQLELIELPAAVCARLADKYREHFPDEEPVVREGLLNVRKHACAAQVDVTVVGLPEGVVVSVVDDGVGLGGEPPEPGHMGLRLLAETLGATGGGLTLDDRPEGGAALTARVPVS